MQKCGSKYFASRPTSSDPWDGIIFSSEHGHVAGKHDGSNMVANSLPADPPPPTPRVGKR